MDFIYRCYHQGREEVLAWNLNYFLGLPNVISDGVEFTLYDNRTDREVEFFVPLDHVQYMEESEEQERGAGWREFRIVYLEPAIDDMEEPDE